MGQEPGVYREGQRPADDRRRLPRHDRGVPQRVAGAPGGAGRCGGRRAERQIRQLDLGPQRRPAFDRTGHVAAAGDQYRGSRQPDQGAAAGLSPPDAAFGEFDHRAGSLRAGARIGERREAHAAAHHGAGGVGHLSVPAQFVGDGDSQPGSSHFGGRHVRGDVADGLLAG